MNYVNRQAAEALKEAGFDVPIIAYYVGFVSKRKDVCFFTKAENHNEFDDISAPDFLTVADWIHKQSNGAIRIALCADHTTFYLGAFVAQMVFDDSDHRNEAIIHALIELKKLKNANNITT